MSKNLSENPARPQDHASAESASRRGSRQTAAIIGASSGVGRAIAEALARRGDDLVLVARDERDLDCLARHLRLTCGVAVHVEAFDLGAAEIDAAALVERWTALAGRLDAMLAPAGCVEEFQRALPADEVIETTIRVNYVNLVKIVTAAARCFEARNCGVIVGFSSIAAAVPRSRNMVYASAKAGWESYLRSLRHFFADGNVIVQVYALGYVDTAMSFGQRMLFPPVSPQAVAARVVRMMGRDIGVVFFPGYWRVITSVLRHLPWALFRRLRF
jgi:short-subunit dehydrogenase